MPLSSLVVSRDWQEVSVLECILGSLQINVTVEREPQQALSKLSKSKVDALIVDCDLNGTSQFLRDLPAIEKEARAVPLVLMGGSQHIEALDQTSALFTFEKPISVDQALRKLSAARNLIVDGRLRYTRAEIGIPVWVRGKGRKASEAQIVNLSQGGMQIQTQTALELSGALRISFELPGSIGNIKADANIVWQDQQGNLGLQFVKVAQRQQKSLQLWLAQQFLAN